MTHIRTLCLVSVVAARACAQDEALDRKSESALIAAAEEVQKAILSSDESILRKRFAADFIMVHGGTGTIESRDRFISFLQSGGRTPPGSDMTIYDRVIRLISTGIVLMTETLNLRQGGRSRWYTVSSIWRKQSEYWQVVYGQRTLIGEGISPSVESLESYRRIAGHYKTSDGREFSVSAQRDRLLMFGPRSMERQDVLIPQGGFEFQVTFYRLKFHVEDTQISATALSNQAVLWTATKTR